MFPPVEGKAYLWRRLDAKQRYDLLEWRRQQGRPWHSPPHPSHGNRRSFHITAACYEHQPWIGQNPERLEAFSAALNQALSRDGNRVQAWCVLPNHYHAMLESSDLSGVMRNLGLLHGRTSRSWNLEDRRPGRQVFHRACDRAIRSERHSWATLNYIHYNPVHHGYVDDPLDWRWSSASAFLESMGETEVLRLWKAYPILDYGRGWDDPDM